MQEQILTTRENIQDLNESIGQLTLKLEASQAEVQDTIDLFKQRLVALYTAGNVSTLEILLDSKSLSDFKMCIRDRSQFTQVTHRGVEDNAVSVLEFEGGAIGVSETGFVTSGNGYFLELSGTQGSLHVFGDHGDRLEYSCLLYTSFESPYPPRWWPR